MKNVIRYALPKLALLLVVFAALPAKAGLYLEPYIGYQLGTWKDNKTSGEGTITGSTVGARVGLSLPIFFVAAEYSLLSGRSKPKVGAEEDAIGSTVFATVGARLPLIRAYAGYGFMNNLEFKRSDSTLKGNAMKLGVGFSGLPFVCINLEYIMSKYSKVKTAAGDFDADSTGNTYMVNVSLPFDF